MKIVSRYCSLLLLFLVLPGCQRQLPQMFEGGAGSDVEPSSANLLRHVEVLAADSYLGRGTGEQGIAMAEEYVASAFGDAGLQPLPGRDDFFVDFSLYRRAFTSEHTQLEHPSKGLSFELGKDFRPFPFSDEGRVEAELVFAGYGITSEEHDWDDYAGLDVEGKIVFVFRHEPGEKDENSAFGGLDTTRHSQFLVKAQNAQDHGAVGMLLVTDPLNHEAGDDLRTGTSFSLTKPKPTEASADESATEEPTFLAAQVSRSAADQLLAYLSVDLETLQRDLDAGSRAVAPSRAGGKITFSVARSRDAETVPARNVVGVLPGSDPAVADEWIAIGAHHDHLGAFSGEGDIVYNGADDNASGTAGVLELVRSFAAEPRGPRRSIVFMTFSAEEKGLLGSKALVNQELIPLDKIKFMLNLDMIGRNEDKPVAVYGDGYATGLREVILAANADVGLDLELGGASYMGASDHDSFYRRDIPFTFLFTGTHEDYHQLGDHVDKVNVPRMRDIVQVARGIVSHVANVDEAPRFVHHVSWLGVQVELVEKAGWLAPVVTNLEEGSRGDEAGILLGDAILGIGDEVLQDAEDVGKVFRGIQTGSRVEMAVLRDGEPMTLEFERAKRGYLGVFPAGVEDERRKELGLGDEEGVLLGSVVDGGPAAKSGLLQGDIIYRIAGQPVNRRSLGRVLARVGAGETVEVALVRGEERMILSLTLGERPTRG